MTRLQRPPAPAAPPLQVAGALAVTWMSGRAAAVFRIAARLCQAAGAAMLMSNPAAILTGAAASWARGKKAPARSAAPAPGPFPVAARL